jgi:hypothetical protein
MDTSTVEQILASAELCLEAIKTLQEVVSVKLDNIQASIEYILKELQ